MSSPSTRLQWLLLQLVRRLWVRATAFSLLGVATALTGSLASTVIPYRLPAMVGADAVGNLLNIIAASMLSVTIFSLSTLVSALGSATNTVTPRATRLLSEDRTAQNALATFLGSFLFSLVGIIALQTGLYSQSGRVVLYVVTLGVIAVIVVTLLRWIDYVSRLGRVGQTTDRVEEVAASALRERRDHPYLGARRADASPPDDSQPVHAARMGYVDHVDVPALSAACGKVCHAWITSLPGTYVDGQRPLARLVGPADDTMRAAVRDAFTVGDARSFDQDPRFGLIVLAEIASRALSPAVNDPGTAIDVIGRATRLLALWAATGERTELEVRHANVHAPEVQLDDLFDDVFNPIGRDGAGLVEVALRIQKALRTLAHLEDGRFRAAAHRHSMLALARAERALDLPDDLARVRAVAEEITARVHAATSVDAQPPPNPQVVR